MYGCNAEEKRKKTWRGKNIETSIFKTINNNPSIRENIIKQNNSR